MKTRPWWISFVLAAVLLALLDRGVDAWNPTPSRLPENFSPSYLDRLLAHYRDRPDVLLVLGDSAIWGYHLAEPDALGSRLASDLPRYRLLNLSIEGGSPANSYVAATAALHAGVHPALAVINLNLKEFSPADRSYQRILPAFEQTARALPADDQRDFIYQKASKETAIARFVERYWMLYRFRLDIRQALFGDVDGATRLAGFAHALTGRQAREDALNAPTADRYLGAYDLEPIADDNISLRYVKRMLALLRGEHVPVLAFLTPTNHGLLHDFIDAPEYDANLRKLQEVVEAEGGRVVDFDRMFPQAAFIDNDHLHPPAVRRLAALLGNAIERDER